MIDYGRMTLYLMPPSSRGYRAMGTLTMSFMVGDGSDHSRDGAGGVAVITAGTEFGTGGWGGALDDTVASGESGGGGDGAAARVVVVGPFSSVGTTSRVPSLTTVLRLLPVLVPLLPETAEPSTKAAKSFISVVLVLASGRCGGKRTLLIMCKIPFLASWSAKTTLAVLSPWR